MKKNSLSLYLFLCCIKNINSIGIAFVHIGKKIPDYLYDALYQARLFNQSEKIYLLATQTAVNSTITQKLGVICMPLESLKSSPEHTDFTRRCTLDDRAREGFWKYASERFLYLNDFMQQHNVQEIIHLESDTLLYAPLAELLPILRTQYPGLAAVFDNDTRCIPSFIYVRDKKSMQKMAAYFAKYANSGKNDMEVIALLKRDHPQEIGNLPIVMHEYRTQHVLESPYGHKPKNPLDYSYCIEQFQSIFDGAALGQYLGGIDPRNGPSAPGFINESCIFNPAHFDYLWVHDHLNRKIPYAIFNGKQYRINTLHIHCKNLALFLSQDFQTKG